MEITKNNLNQDIGALRWCTKENKSKTTDTGRIRISYLCDDVTTYLEKEYQGEIAKQLKMDNLSHIDHREEY